MTQRSITDRQGVSRLALIIAAAALAGCTTTAEQQMYVDWIAVANPATACGGQPDCVQHSTYRGKKICKIVTADKGVSYARLGEQVRECLRTPAATNADPRHE